MVVHAIYTRQLEVAQPGNKCGRLLKMLRVWHNQNFIAWQQKWNLGSEPRFESRFEPRFKPDLNPSFKSRFETGLNSRSQLHVMHAHAFKKDFSGKNWA